MASNEEVFGDLPEDRSTVLLLGVTRIPTSPLPVRRPSTLPLDPIESDTSQNPSSAQYRRNSFSARRQQVCRRSSSVKKRTASTDLGKCTEEKGADTATAGTVPSNSASLCNDSITDSVMERSVDSIGTCSLDVEASADLSDWSGASSGGTLRSASLKTPSGDQHLPSYLSLACTVNGYSTTTNYDPIRLARSRDASPHRLDNDPLTPKNQLYAIQNNLLSPPNLVPLPTHIKHKMADNTLAQQYRVAKTTHESHASVLFGNDTTDACYEKNFKKCTTFESKHYSSTTNGQSKCTIETNIQEYSNITESKSFIEQRVERLYGPGALAHGFLVMKQRKTDCDSDTSLLNDSKNGILESPMKQSSSSPALPVLRHLRPEFRAQLPIISPRKGVETSIQKSSTLPTLADEVNMNGHSKQIANSDGGNIAQSVISEESGRQRKEAEKDGHYFLKILQNETNRLLKHADVVEKELENNELTEEIIGKIHSATGKARLLVSQKMQQFKGLCTNNITQGENEAFPTTNEDLQGFWDMVMLQVNQVDTLFKEIAALKANNWKEVKNEPANTTLNGKARKIVSRVKVPATSAGNDEARKKREAQRKQIIEERRKAMKAQNKPVESIEIFVAETS